VIKVFVYLRVSGKGQIDGDGFDRQLLACQKYAAENGYEIVTIFREEGQSGKKELEHRPALSELFIALEENGVKGVLIEKLDRLARDLMIQETIIADMQRKGYTLLSAAEPDLCSDDPSRVLVRQIFGAIAQYERAMIVLKLRGARQRKKARRGKCEGRHAFGEKPAEARTLGQIAEWAATGTTPQQIAADLNSCDYKTRSGKPWRGTTVAKIVRRLKVAGYNFGAAA
jgi:DNA invertase Pin-like site-specific DNA recombinase